MRQDINTLICATALCMAGASGAFAQSHRIGGGFADAQAGYNYQFRNNVVLGVESDLQRSGIPASNCDSSVIRASSR